MQCRGALLFGFLSSSVAPRPRSRRHEHLQLAKVAVAVCGRRIAAGTKQVRSLVVKAKRLHWGDHRSPATTRNEHGFLTHLARQRPRERMLK